MNIFYLSIIVSVIILIPYSSSDMQCLFDNYEHKGSFNYVLDKFEVKNETRILCTSSYTGEDIPHFSKSNIIYKSVSYTYSFL